jgi:hypothetical protein
MGSNVLRRIVVMLWAVWLAVGPTSRVAHGQGAERAFGAAMGDAAGAVIPLLLLPSNVGPEFRFPRGGGADFRFVLGWPIQFPLPFGRHPTLAHRLTLAPEVAIGTTEQAVFRGRGGYRFGWRMLTAGLSVGADKTAFFVTPELGLRLPRAPDDFAFGGLLTARCDLEPADKVVRLSVMFGWVLL